MLLTSAFRTAALRCRLNYYSKNILTEMNSQSFPFSRNEKSTPPPPSSLSSRYFLSSKFGITRGQSNYNERNVFTISFADVSNHRRRAWETLNNERSYAINCFLRPGRGACSQIYRGIKLEIGNFLSLSLFLHHEGGEKIGFSARKKEVICMLEADTEAIWHGGARAREGSENGADR